jgi:hypothetical protein
MIPLQLCEVIVEKRLANRTVRAFFRPARRRAALLDCEPLML